MISKRPYNCAVALCGEQSLRQSVSFSINQLFAHRQIGFYCQSTHELEELIGLADEESVRREGLKGSHGSASGLGWVDDRTRRKPSVEERRRLGHDQVGLEILAPKRRSVQVGEGYVHTSHGVHGIGYWRRVAGFVGPRLEVHDLGSANT